VGRNIVQQKTQAQPNPADHISKHVRVGKGLELELFATEIDAEEPPCESALHPSLSHLLIILRLGS
jgi:hypothetical protein